MKRITAVIGACAVAAFLTTACNQAEEPREEGAPAGEAGSPADTPREGADMDVPSAGMMEEQVVSGELKSVDSDARTFTIQTDDGREMTLSYNDATDVGGAAGEQGLTGREGTRVTVHYREQPGADTSAASTRGEAVRIVMAEQDEPQPQQ